MAIIKLINTKLIDVNVKGFVKDGVAFSSLDIKSIAITGGKSKNICRISLPGAWNDEIACIDDAVSVLSRDDKFVHKNRMIEKYKNITTAFSLSENSLSENNEESVSSVYYIMAIPYNGNIDAVDITADLGTIKLLNATTIKTDSFTMNEKSKLKFAKVLYMIMYSDTAAANINIEFNCKSYPKTDDGAGMKMVERRLSMPIHAEHADAIIPDVTSVNTTELTPDENGEFNIPAPLKFGQMLTAHDARNTIVDIALSDVHINICEAAPYPIVYTGVIKEKKANDNHNKSEKPFKYSKKPNNNKDDSAKKANSHEKSINKLNKAKSKFID